MRSLHIGNYFGIPVKIHWSFGLMIAYILYISLTEGLSQIQSLAFSAYIATLFVCVILHEFGHALSARRYGIQTLDITISPIGGLARLERLPKRPLHELIVAIAGPLVNVAIAFILILLGYLIWSFEGMLQHPPDLLNLSNPIVFINSTIILNVILFLFNLIPAFPMDGGRILRAVLAMKWKRSKATQMAAYVGQGLAVIFIILSLYYGVVTWAFIGLFVYFTASTENKSVQLEESLLQKTAVEVCNSDFTTLFIGDSMSAALEAYKRTGEKVFLVENSLGTIVGILANPILEKAKVKSTIELQSEKVMQHMTQNFATADSSISLLAIFHMMNSRGLSLVKIKNGDQILGVIDRHTIQSLIKQS